MLLRRLPSDKSARLACAVLAGLCLFSPLLRSQLPNAPMAGAHESPANGYVGDEACRGCHQREFEGYQGSAHRIASRLPSEASILGKFTSGSNILRTSNPFLYFQMTATAEGFFQTAFAQMPPSETVSRRERFGLVIGSGRKGQTYLYWRGDQLFEMPVSYWTGTGQWMNSPGYPDGLPNFDKPIIPRCLECHTSYFRALGDSVNRFDPRDFVLGITCERCHGAGRIHVARTQAHKPRPQAPDIVNPALLSPQRQMDLCALCHAGAGMPRAPAFSFTVGQELSRYLSITETVPDTPTDVHGHQVQLLTDSRCFRSAAMTCATCHNVHQAQRDLAAFSERCLSCHKVESCGRFRVMGSRILLHCVDCHMPLRTSNQIVFDSQGHQIRPEVRSHRIGIYRDIAGQ
jgi:Cytochrome c554 and c-prime